jgi:hypothetical protein
MAGVFYPIIIFTEQLCVHLVYLGLCTIFVKIIMRNEVYLDKDERFFAGVVISYGRDYTCGVRGILPHLVWSLSPASCNNRSRHPVGYILRFGKDYTIHRSAHSG